MPDMRKTGEENLERSESYGLGQRRERVLMEVFVLTESGKLVAVFSSKRALSDHIALCPTTFDFIQSPDGLKTEERVCDYHVQRVRLDTVLTDA